MMSDPIGDMLARIRNAQMAGKAVVSFPNSKLKRATLDVLRAEGFILGYRESDDRRTLQMEIKYYTGRPAIESIRRRSRPGLRVYCRAANIRPVRNGLGVAVVSTSKGVMADHRARELNLGGEILCEVC